MKRSVDFVLGVLPPSVFPAHGLAGSSLPRRSEQNEHAVRQRIHQYPLQRIRLDIGVQFFFACDQDSQGGDYPLSYNLPRNDRSRWTAGE